MLQLKTSQEGKYVFLTVDGKDGSLQVVNDSIHGMLHFVDDFPTWASLNDLALKNVKQEYDASSCDIEYAIDKNSWDCFTFVFLEDAMREQKQEYRDWFLKSKEFLNVLLKDAKIQYNHQLVLLTFRDGYGLVLNEVTRDVYKLDSMCLAFLSMYEKLSIRSKITTDDSRVCISPVDNYPIMSLLGFSDSAISKFQKELCEGGCGDLKVSETLHSELKTGEFGKISDLSLSKYITNMVK